MSVSLSHTHTYTRTLLCLLHASLSHITWLYCSFDANAGLFEQILGPEDAVISDALNHASIIDGTVHHCTALYGSELHFTVLYCTEL